jgi:acyl-CoA thioester hydrolase
MIEYTTPIYVRYGETDQMGRAHHSSFVLWFELARMNLLREIGVPYGELEKKGYFLPVAEIQIIYKKAVTFEEKIRVVARINKIPKARIRITYRALNIRNELVAEGNSMHIFMKSNGTPQRPPKIFRDRVPQLFKE